MEEETTEHLAAALEAADTEIFAGSAHTSDVSQGSDEDPDVPAEVRKARRRMANRRGPRGQEKRKYTKTGKISFTTSYQADEQKLEVMVIRAFDLGKRKEHDFVNPFVRLYLLPGKKQKQHTRVKRRTKEPYFNEKRMFYNISEYDLKSYRLKLKVYSREAIAKNELLGETEFALGSLNLAQKESFVFDLFMAKDEVRFWFFPGDFSEIFKDL